MAATLSYSASTAVPGDTVTLDITGIVEPQSDSQIGTGTFYSTPVDSQFQDYEEATSTLNSLEISGTGEFTPTALDPSASFEILNERLATINVTHRTSNNSKLWRQITYTLFNTVKPIATYPAPPNYDLFPLPPSQFTITYNPAAEEEIGVEIIDPIVEPTYTESPIVSVEEDGNWQAGGTYDVVVNEVETYSGYFAGYESVRTTGLVGTGGSSVAGYYFNDKKGLINESGLTSLFAAREYDSTFYRGFSEVIDSAVDAGVVDSVTQVSSVLVEDVTGDPDTDEWYRKRTYLRTYRFVISETANPTSSQYIVFTTFENDTVEDFSSQVSTTTYDTGLTVSTHKVFEVNPTPFPVDRPASYDEDKVWDPILEEWVDLGDLTTLGGGSYKRHLVVLGHRKIYFGEV